MQSAQAVTQSTNNVFANQNRADQEDTTAVSEIDNVSNMILILHSTIMTTTFVGPYLVGSVPLFPASLVPATGLLEGQILPVFMFHLGHLRQPDSVHDNVRHGVYL